MPLVGALPLYFPVLHTTQQQQQSTTSMVKWPHSHHLYIFQHADDSLGLCEQFKTLQFTNKIQKGSQKLEKNNNHFQHSDANPLATEEYLLTSYLYLS